jgi:hypothetical protein
MLEARPSLISTALRTRRRLAGFRHTKGKHMRETGMLSIVRRGNTYQVRYASFNPYDMDRLPYQCSAEAILVALLHHYGIDAWSCQQAVAALRKGEVAVLPVVLSEALLQAYFPLQRKQTLPVSTDTGDTRGQADPPRVTVPGQEVA